MNNIWDVLANYVDANQENSSVCYFVRGEPSFDVIESAQKVTIAADIPGMKKENIDIKIDNNTLTISGTREVDINDTDMVWFSERFFGSFSRSITVPENTDKSNISAKYTDGVLEIIIPKIQNNHQSSSIKIQ